MSIQKGDSLADESPQKERQEAKQEAMETKAEQPKVMPQQTAHATAPGSHVHAPRQGYGMPDGHKSLNDLIKESSNAQAQEVKGTIDTMRKERSSMVDRIKKLRIRLEYKQSELVAITGFLESEKAKQDPKKGRELKRMKNMLEFKLSTEAKMSLTAERDIVRKINDISAQLDDFYKVVRLERKQGFIKGDIEQYKKELEELEKNVTGLDAKLDDKYRELKHLLGIDERRMAKPKPKRHAMPIQVQKINLEDIAVIKKKDK